MSKEMIQHTYGIFDPQSIELSLPKSTPNLRQVYFVGIVQATVNGHNMLHKYSHSHGTQIRQIAWLVEGELPEMMSGQH